MTTDQMLTDLRAACRDFSVAALEAIGRQLGAQLVLADHFVAVRCDPPRVRLRIRAPGGQIAVAYELAGERFPAAFGTAVAPVIAHALTSLNDASRAHVVRLVTAGPLARRRRPPRFRRGRCHTRPRRRRAARARVLETIVTARPGSLKCRQAGVAVGRRELECVRIAAPTSLDARGARIDPTYGRNRRRQRRRLNSVGLSWRHRGIFGARKSSNCRKSRASDPLGPSSSAVYPRRCKRTSVSSAISPPSCGWLPPTCGRKC